MRWIPAHEAGIFIARRGSGSRMITLTFVMLLGRCASPSSSIYRRAVAAHLAPYVAHDPACATVVSTSSVEARSVRRRRAERRLLERRGLREDAGRRLADARQLAHGPRRPVARAILAPRRTSPNLAYTRFAGDWRDPLAGARGRGARLPISHLGGTRGSRAPQHPTARSARRRFRRHRHLTSLGGAHRASASPAAMGYSRHPATAAVRALPTPCDQGDASRHVGHLVSYAPSRAASRGSLADAGHSASGAT